MILPDTNILVYAINADAPQHRAARSLLNAALAGRVPFVLVAQVLLEFFAVITHPRRVQRPLSPEVAWEQIATLRASLPMLDVPAVALDTLQELVRSRQPIGGRVFDLFLVAQMTIHRIPTICTYDTSDFANFSGVEAVTPDDLLARFDLSDNGSS